MRTLGVRIGMGRGGHSGKGLEMPALVHSSQRNLRSQEAPGLVLIGITWDERGWDPREEREWDPGRRGDGSQRGRGAGIQKEKGRDTGKRGSESQGEKELGSSEESPGSWLLGWEHRGARGTRGSRERRQTQSGSPSSRHVSVTGGTRTGPGRTSPTAGPAGTVPASSTGEGQPRLPSSRGFCFPALPDFTG